MEPHIFPIRIYYEDTDAGGIVYHARYLNFFERARTEALRALGIELFDLLSKHNTQFVVVSAAIDYLRAATLDQLLYVKSSIIEAKTASFMYNQELRTAAIEGDLICKAKIRLACLDQNRRPRRLPKFLNFCNSSLASSIEQRF